MDFPIQIINDSGISKFYVISYYTENYYEYLKKFEKFLERFQIKYYIEMLQGKWEWKKACNYKPEFILKCWYMLLYPVLWIDIDAVVHSDLNYFNKLTEKNIDIAFYYRDAKELLSGTLFFNNTKNSRKVLELWKDESKNINLWDQRNLQQVLLKNEIKDLKIDYLSANYCYFDLLKNRLDENDKIHIEHFQASRKFNPDHPIYGKNRRK